MFINYNRELNTKLVKKLNLYYFNQFYENTKIGNH